MAATKRIPKLWWLFKASLDEEDDLEEYGDEEYIYDAFLSSFGLGLFNIQAV